MDGAQQPVGRRVPQRDGRGRLRREPAEGALDGHRQRRRHPRHRRARLDRLARLARLHPHDGARRDRPLSARAGRARRCSSGSATLPSDHTLRPPRRADDEAVLRVLLARDVADVGYPDFTIEDLHADWATPGLDLERDARVVDGRRRDRRLVAAARRRRADLRPPRRVRARARHRAARARRGARARARHRGPAPVHPDRQRGRRAAAARRGLLARAALLPDADRARGRAAATPTAPCASFERDQDEIAVHALVQDGLVGGRGLHRRAAGGLAPPADREEALGPGAVARCSRTTRAWPAPRSASAGTTGSATSPSSRSRRGRAGAATGARCCWRCSRRSAPAACAARSCPCTATTAGPRASTSRSA